MTLELAKARTGRFLLVGDVRLPLYSFQRQLLLLMSDLVDLLGPRVLNWRQRLPVLSERRYSVRVALDGEAHRERLLFTLEGALLLCRRYMRRRDGGMFELLRDEIARLIGAPVVEPSSRPEGAVPCSLPALPGPLVLAGQVLHRFAFQGRVWLSARDLLRVPGVSPWLLLRRAPHLSGEGGAVKRRIVGHGSSPCLLLALPVVWEMALMCRGPAALALFEVVSEEIAAGRHLFPGGAHGK